MARFSPGFLTGLGNPAMLQDFRSMGAALGNVPTQYREQQTRKADAAELSKYPKGSPEYYEAMARMAERNGDMQAAAAATEAARKVKRLAVTQGREDSEYAVGQSEQIVKAQGLMNQVEGALNSGKLSKEMQQEGGKLLKSLAVSGQGAAGAEGIVKEFLTRSGISAGEGYKFGDEATIRDSEGNLFTSAVIYEKGTSKPRRVLTPQPGSPAEPIGKTVLVSTTTGAGAFDKPGIAGSTATEKEYGEMRAEAAASIPQIRLAQRSARRSLELLKTINTGGWSNKVVDAAQDILGVQPKDRAEFALRAGEQVLDKLSVFTGAISEGERAYLERLYQSLERSNGANEAILEEIIAHSEYLMDDAVRKVKSGNFNEYVDSLEVRDRAFTDEELEGDQEVQKAKVSWNDLND